MSAPRNSIAVFALNVILPLLGGCERVWVSHDPTPVRCDSGGLACRVDVVRNTEELIDIGCGGVRRETLASYLLNFPRNPGGAIADSPASVRILKPANYYSVESGCSQFWKAGQPYDLISAGESPTPAWTEAVTHAINFAESLPHSNAAGRGAAYLFVVTPDRQCVAVCPTEIGEPPTFEFAGQTFRRGDAFVWFSTAFPHGTAVDGVAGTVLSDTVTGSLIFWQSGSPDGSIDEFTIRYRTGETTRHLRNLLPSIEMFEQMRTADRR